MIKVIEIKNCQSCPNHTFRAYPWSDTRAKMVCNFHKEFMKQKTIPEHNVIEHTIPDWCLLKEI